MTARPPAGSASAPIRVLVAEDQRLVRAGIVTMLGVDPACEVVAEAADGATAVREALRTQPDVALIDLRMPGMDGLEATRQITAKLPRTRVLVLTTFGADEWVFAALASGASGFLLKDSRPEDLLEAVAAIARGEGRLDPAVTASVVAHFRSHASAPAGNSQLDLLTERETEVLVLISSGLSNVQIAAELRVAAGTVKTHVGNVLAKLGARDRVQAVIAAYEGGLVRP
jgi:DNA-binding NarL/FixJ family response regulator